MALSEIPLTGDWEYEWALTRKGSDGVRAPYTGVTTAIAFLSLTEGVGATTIHASLQKTLIERVGKPGTYAAVAEEADKITHLAALTGRVVYEVFKIPGDAQYTQPLLVTAE